MPVRKNITFKASVHEPTTGSCCGYVEGFRDGPLGSFASSAGTLVVARSIEVRAARSGPGTAEASRKGRSGHDVEEGQHSDERER
jgi:hypothetical protein